MNWTAEQDEILKNGRRDGLSYGEIGERLGISRHACIGRAHRRGYDAIGMLPEFAERAKGRLRVRKSAVMKAAWDNPLKFVLQRSPGYYSAIVARRQRKPRAERRPRPHRLPEPLSLGLSLLELTPITCRWPHGDPREPGFHFCGQPAPFERSYCAFHQAMAARSGTQADFDRMAACHTGGRGYNRILQT